MLKEFEFSADNAAAACTDLVAAWAQPDNKVFALRARESIDNIRDFYEQLFPALGTPAALAEDVNLGARDQQRSDQIWMEVRYDPNYPDAYRHSANAQPLHTDGSYIPDFPNATLMACVANVGDGGETIFLDSKKLYQILADEQPDMLAALTSMPVKHTRSGDEKTAAVIQKIADEVKLNWNYFCVARDLDADTRALVEQFQDFLQTAPAVREAITLVKLNPGDAVTWKDDYVLHGRNSFVANSVSERFIWKCAIDIGNFNG